MQSSGVVMYYTVEWDKCHSCVIKGLCTDCRHYIIFGVMQYEPHSATFQLEHIYTIGAGWNDDSCVVPLDDCMFTVYRKISETL